MTFHLYSSLAWNCPLQAFLPVYCYSSLEARINTVSPWKAVNCSSTSPRILGLHFSCAHIHLVPYVFVFLSLHSNMSGHLENGDCVLHLCLLQKPESYRIHVHKGHVVSLQGMWGGWGPKRRILTERALNLNLSCSSWAWEQTKMNLTSHTS